MDAEYDPAFTFAHDYSAHRYDCPIAEGGVANILECTCGYGRAFAESEAYLNGLRAERDSLRNQRDERNRNAAGQFLAQIDLRRAAEARAEALATWILVNCGPAALAAARPERCTCSNEAGRGLLGLPHAADCPVACPEREET